MATIDGIECNIQTIKPTTTHRNKYTKSIGSYNNTITDMGYDGLTIQISGYELTQSAYDAVIAIFKDNGEHSLIIKPGWEYRVYPITSTLSMDVGITDNYFPYTLSMRTETPYVYSQDDMPRSWNIDTNNTEWDVRDDSLSLLDNWDFQEWTDGTAVVPDYWTIGVLENVLQLGSGSAHHGDYFVRLHDTTGICQLYQYRFDIDIKSGDTFTVGAWLKTNDSLPVSARLAVNFYGATNLNYSSYITLTASWVWHTWEATASADHTHLAAMIEGSTTNKYLNVDSVILIRGTDISSAIPTVKRTVAAPTDIEIIASDTMAGTTTIISQTEGS